jgi:hypothetical protein
MKKIGVIVNTANTYRQSEVVRVALGLTLMDDRVELIVLGRKLTRSKAVKKNLKLLGMMKGKAYSDNSENELEPLSLEEIAKKLTEYDVVMPY